MLFNNSEAQSSVHPLNLLVPKKEVCIGYLGEY